MSPTSSGCHLYFPQAARLCCTHQSCSTGKTEASPRGSPLGKAGVLGACTNTFLSLGEGVNINTQWNTIQPLKKKHGISAICDNMDEPWGPYAK